MDKADLALLSEPEVQVNGGVKNEKDRSPRYRFLKLAAVNSTVSIICFFPMNKAMVYIGLASFGAAILIYLAATGYAIYRFFKGDVAKSRLILTVFSMLVLWAVSIAGFIKDTMGDFQLSYLSLFWERGLMGAAFSHERFFSMFMLASLLMGYILAFKSKRNAKSIVNVTLYTAVFFICVYGFELISK
ncbi:hypothetical protein R0J87_09480 [Halomonas sp. SIMBA_159]